MINAIRNLTKYFLIISAVLTLSACGGGGGGDDGGGGGSASVTPTKTSLNQAAYVSGTTTYQYAHRSIPNMFITGAPDDTDWSRWAMLHDGSTYRLYFFKSGTNDTLYQFGFNPNSSDYEFGFNSIPTLTITGAPADADASSFAMLYDGTTYRLYMRSVSSDTKIHQFGFNSSTSDYEYGFNSIPVLDITGGPADADYDRWAMLHDGTTYRYYAFSLTLATAFYQFGYNPSTQDYEFGRNSIPQLTIQSMPTDSNTDDFAMLHDGVDYRFYYQTK